MRMVNIASIGLAIIVHFVPTFAEAEPLSDAIYCPESVTCKINGDVNSCSYKTSTPDMWEKNVSDPTFGKNVKVGRYKLYRVWAYKHSRLFRQADCMYINENTDPQKAGINFITVYNPKLANLGIMSNQKWESSIINKVAGLGDCHTSDPRECPLSQHSSLIIHNSNMHDGVFVSANGAHVNLEKPIGEREDVKVLYDDVLAGCGSEDICQIDITSKQGGVYGYVYVDMTKHMKVLSVHSWRPSEVEMVQIEGFNAVKIGYPN